MTSSIVGTSADSWRDHDVALGLREGRRSVLPPALQHPPVAKQLRFRRDGGGYRSSVTVFDVFTAVFLVVVGLVVAFGCYLIVYVLVDSARRRRVVRIGKRTTARCIHAYYGSSHPSLEPPDRPRRFKRRFVMGFTGPGGDLIRFEDLSVPDATREGDELTVAHLPGRPESAVVVTGDEKSGLDDTLRILAALCGFLVVMAGIAYIGVAILDGYESAAADPGSWIEP
ncbi:DUF3592 domain-containing protein [Streptomyces sp. NPDC047737]|uniref:DUF3592 domain-containing protein n=1 Tax=Streptomyces sp. NPDC047737 TaxID=3155740 RepID=UPI0033CEE1D4